MCFPGLACERCLLVDAVGPYPLQDCAHNAVHNATFLPAGVRLGMVRNMGGRGDRMDRGGMRGGHRGGMRGGGMGGGYRREGGGMGMGYGERLSMGMGGPRGYGRSGGMGGTGNMSALGSLRGGGMGRDRDSQRP